jgi:hypothetical protein
MCLLRTFSYGFQHDFAFVFTLLTVDEFLFFCSSGEALVLFIPVCVDQLVTSGSAFAESLP